MFKVGMESVDGLLSRVGLPVLLFVAPGRGVFIRPAGMGCLPWRRL